MGEAQGEEGSPQEAPSQEEGQAHEEDAEEGHREQGPGETCQEEGPQDAQEDPQGQAKGAKSAQEAQQGTQGEAQGSEGGCEGCASGNEHKSPCLQGRHPCAHQHGWFCSSPPCVKQWKTHSCWTQTQR